MNYTVDSEQPIRLDVWLSQKLGQSRSQVQKLIKSGSVLVNGKERSPHFEIKNEDEIQIRESIKQRNKVSTPSVIASDPDVASEERSNLVQSRKNEIARLDRHKSRQASSVGLPRNDNAEIKILFESSDYLIVEKPIGVVVHPDAKHKGNTLIDFLLKKYPEIKNAGDQERPGVVHRLDKEVSGLLVVARNQHFYDHIKHQFDERTVTKEYAALVFGEIINTSGTISFRLVRSKTQEKYTGLPPTSDDLDSKDAETQYEVVSANQHYSLVRLFPKTGRTHQLRVHMRTFGHPIAGDHLYELPAFRHLNRKFSRVMLHARRIRFQNLAGESVKYESLVPNEMGSAIEGIFHVKI